MTLGFAQSIGKRVVNSARILSPVLQAGKKPVA